MIVTFLWPKISAEAYGKLGESNTPRKKNHFKIKTRELFQKRRKDYDRNID
jgi:hypothetical protein